MNIADRRAKARYELLVEGHTHPLIRSSMRRWESLTMTRGEEVMRRRFFSRFIRVELDRVRRPFVREMAEWFGLLHTRRALPRERSIT